MKKKLLSIFLLLVLVLSLVACAGNAGNNTSENNGGEVSGDVGDAVTPAEPIADINGDGKITIACVHRNLLGASGVNFRAAYYYTAAQMDDVEIMFYDGNQDVTKQCNYIEDCMASKACDAFIVWTCDPDGIVGTVQAAHDAGYPIIVIDISLDCDQEAFVAAGNYEMGVMTGESAVEYLTEKNGSPSGKVYIGVSFRIAYPNSSIKPQFGIGIEVEW